MESNGLVRSADRPKRFFKSQLDNDTRNARPYRPLDSARHEIRLLVVKPGSGNEMVDCSLEHAYLNEVPIPQYETTSYVWGDASVRATVGLEGHIIDVPASSERVLRRFRLVDQQRTLWIDAVCINQNDQGERSSQVALMYEIYSCTVRNLVWLGEDNGTTTVALNAIHQLVEDMRVETNDFAAVKTVLYDKSGRLRTATTGLPFSLLPGQTKALIQFYSTEWLRRLWVIQEAALAPTSICYRGDAQCSLQHVLRAAEWLVYKVMHVPKLALQTGIQNAGCMFDLCDDEIGKYQLFRMKHGVTNVLTDTRRFEVSDPRDYVFAILGLACKRLGMTEIPTLLRPDYTKPTSTVFRDMTSYWIQKRQDLNILIIVTHRLDDLSPLALPTWVPAWNQLYDRNVDAVELRWSVFDACSTERRRLPNLQHIQDRNLTLTGVLVGESVLVSQPIGSANTVDMRRTKQSDMYLRAFKSSDQSSATFVLPDRFELAMILTAGCNFLQERWNNESCMLSSISHDKAVEKGGITIYSKLTSASTEDERLASEFDEAIYRAWKNRCFFSTGSGRTGLGPQTMRSGDIVALLYGCRLPAILRRVDRSEDRYEFVGLCYVYGIMDGEVVEEYRAAGKEDIVFTLV